MNYKGFEKCTNLGPFQIVADHLIKESGVRPILHCYAVEAIMENDTIKGIITESKSGRQAILADRVIDCTGDADVAYLAGAEYRYVYRNPKYLIKDLAFFSNKE